MNILVFCSAQEVPEKYTKAAEEFGMLIGKAGHNLVWGGTDRGMMHTVSDAVRKAGGKLIGITTEYFKHKVRKDVDEMYVALDLPERKKMMLERGDALVVLPGGIGTLDEALAMLALKREGMHQKPIVFLNTDAYFSGLQEQFARMEREGFLANADKDVIPGLGITYFANSPKDVMTYITNNHGR